MIPEVVDSCSDGENAPASAAAGVVPGVGNFIEVFLPESAWNGSPVVITGPKPGRWNGSPVVLTGPKPSLLLPVLFSKPNFSLSTTWVHRRLDSVSTGRPGHGISSDLSLANWLPSLLHRPRLCWGCRLSSPLMAVRPLGTEAAGTRPVRSAELPGRRLGDWQRC